MHTHVLMSLYVYYSPVITRKMNDISIVLALEVVDFPKAKSVANENHKEFTKGSRHLIFRKLSCSWSCFVSLLMKFLITSLQKKTFRQSRVYMRVDHFCCYM